MESSARPTFLREFFFELVKDSELFREDFQRDRGRWFRQLDLYRKEETLFELEMYLRAIGCFFNLHNQFMEDQDQAITRDFSEELKVLRSALERAARLSQLLLDRGLASSMNFQSFLENQAGPDYLRLQLLRRALDQRRPEESLFVLSRCLRDLKKILDHVLKRSPCPYSLFFHFGQVVAREIAFNRFFNPLLILEFRPEYDRIRSVQILDALRGIPAAPERRALRRIFLGLLRLLHYLRYVPRQGSPQLLRRSLILFTLFHSEAVTLAGFLKILSSRDTLSGPVAASASATSDLMRDELKRLFGEQRVIVDVERSKLFGDQERSLKASRELLEAFLSGCVIRFLRHYQPGLETDDLFDASRARREQALRLRQDLWVYRRLGERVIGDLEKGLAHGLKLPAYWVEFSESFFETSYNLLRYGDGAPFESYLALLAEAQEWAPGNPQQARGFLLATSSFQDALNRIYDEVCLRSDLRGVPLEEDALALQLDHWLPLEEDPA